MKGLTSLNELLLTSETEKSIAKVTNRLEDIVTIGRIAAFNQATSDVEIAPWKRELAARLSDAGLVRPTTELVRYFGLCKFYNAVFDLHLPESIEGMSFEQYEKFEPIPDKVVSDIRGDLLRHTELSGLSAVQVDAYLDSLGVRDGILRSPAVICEFYSLKGVGSINAIKKKVLNDAREYQHDFPAIFYDSSIDVAMSNLMLELCDLRNSWEFQRERELANELSMLKRVPVKHKPKNHGVFSIDGDKIYTDKTNVDDIRYYYDLYFNDFRRLRTGLAKMGKSNEINTLGDLAKLTTDEVCKAMRPLFARSFIQSIHELGVSFADEVDPE